MSNQKKYDLSALADLGMLLHRTRVARRLTQRELAQRTGVSVRLVRELELGARDVRLSSVLQLLNRLGFNLEAVSRRPAAAADTVLDDVTVRGTKRVRRPRARPADGA